jgi:hypothetical protein
MNNPIDPIEFQSLCRSCARAIYDTRPPTAEYAERTAQLLFMTAAHESHLKYRRQIGLENNPVLGAFGLCQTEPAPIRDTLDMLIRRPRLAENCRTWLDQETRLQEVPFTGPHALYQFLDLLQQTYGDRLALMLCRLHYFRVPEPIPRSIEDRAFYAKRHYNTLSGRATSEDYLHTFHKYWPTEYPYITLNSQQRST